MIPSLTQDGTGAESSIRWAFLFAVPVGCLVVLACTVALFLNNPMAIAGMTIGAGLVGLAFGGKAWQANAESRSGAL